MAWNVMLTRDQSISLIQLAIVSRLLIILLQFISNNLIPDHDADVFIAPKSSMQNTSKCNDLIELFVGGFRRWDAEYFLHIAENGYTYENTLAFYPLYPMSVRFVTNAVQLIMPGWFQQCSYRSLLLITAVTLNIYFFAMAVKSLYKLSVLILYDEHKSKLVAILFCFNPAGIFFTAPYTESLFSWLTFEVMIKCCERKFGKVIIPLCLSMLCRSNGVLNIGFVLFYAAKNVTEKFSLLRLAKTGTMLIVIVFCAFMTFSVLQMYQYLLYCTDYKLDLPNYLVSYGQENNFVIAGQMNKTSSPWCLKPIPLSYSYIQSNYWNVGFLNYFEVKQIPNFLLASPILYIFIFHSVLYFLSGQNGVYQVPSDNRFVYIVHGFCLSIFCLFFVHIQVSTRMLASSGPCLYWYVAEYFYDRKRSRKLDNNLSYYIKQILFPRTNYGKFVRNWFLAYNFIGTILFSNFLPWT